jgi:drug/metabolite transporter (DMT)-like permease
MRTWLILAGVLFIVYGVMRWLSALYFQFAEAPTVPIVTVVIGIVLVGVAYLFVKEKKAGA